MRVQSQALIDLFFDAIHIGRWKVDFVNDRNNFQVVLQSQVKIGQRLGFDPLGGIDQQQSPFTGCQGSRNFIGKVYVTGGVNQIQEVGLIVICSVRQANRLAFYGNPAFALNIHRIENLVLKIPF